MIATADDHRIEAEVAEYNARAALILGDKEAAMRLTVTAEYHRKRQQELSK